MKDKHIFYSVCCLAVFVLCAIGIGYATDILPRYQTSDINDSQLTTDTTHRFNRETAATSENKIDTVRSSAKKKNCPCCRGGMEALKAHLEKIRNQRRTKKTEPQESQ